jgi:hypothetical protein
VLKLNSDVKECKPRVQGVGKYRGIIHCASTIIKEEGARGLWQGLTLVPISAQVELLCPPCNPTCP